MIYYEKTLCYMFTQITRCIPALCIYSQYDAILIVSLTCCALLAEGGVKCWPVWPIVAKTMLS